MKNERLKIKNIISSLDENTKEYATRAFIHYLISGGLFALLATTVTDEPTKANVLNVISFCVFLFSALVNTEEAIESYIKNRRGKYGKHH